MRRTSTENIIDQALALRQAVRLLMEDRPEKLEDQARLRAALTELSRELKQSSKDLESAMYDQMKSANRKRAEVPAIGPLHRHERTKLTEFNDSRICKQIFLMVLKSNPKAQKDIIVAIKGFLKIFLKCCTIRWKPTALLEYGIDAEAEGLAIRKTTGRYVSHDPISLEDLLGEDG